MPATTVTAPSIQTRWHLNRRRDTRSVTVTCPECGSDYSHVADVFTRLGSDPYEARAYRGTKVLGAVDERRSCLVIVFEGECGHTFELRIQQHKGNNFVTAEAVGSRREPKSWFARLRRSLRVRCSRGLR